MGVFNMTFASLNRCDSECVHSSGSFEFLSAIASSSGARTQDTPGVAIWSVL